MLALALLLGLFTAVANVLGSLLAVSRRRDGGGSIRNYIGFGGGFLLGLGAAWIVFTTYKISGNLFSWLMILGGASIAASSLLSRNRAMRQVNSLIGGIIGGFVVALVFSYAFGYVGFFPGLDGVTGSGTPVTGTMSFTGFTSVSAAMGFRVEITESST